MNISTPPSKFYKPLVTLLLTALLALAVCGGALATSPPGEVTVNLDTYESFEEAYKDQNITPSAVTTLKIIGKTTGGKWKFSDGVAMQAFKNLKELDMKGYTGVFWDQLDYNVNNSFASNNFSHVRLPADAIFCREMFRDCQNLTTLAFGDKTYEEGAIDLRDYKGRDYGRDYGFQSFIKSGIKKVLLPANIPIGNSMFSGCQNLTTLAVGSNTPTTGVIDLTGYTASYDASAFQECSNITQVRLPANIALSSSMFYKCSNLTTLAVGSNPFDPGVIDLRGYEADDYGYSGAFQESGITTVRLPADTPSLSVSMFQDCSSLTTLAVGNNTPTTGVIDLTGYKANIYGTHAFKGSGIRTVRLPAGTALSWNMFYGCKSLTTLAVGDQPFTTGVIDLTGYTANDYGNAAFQLSGIRTVYLPTNVPLSKNMFASCKSLSTLVFIGGNAPSVDETTTFQSVNNDASRTLYYPEGATGYGANEFSPAFLSKWRRRVGLPVPDTLPPKTGDSARPLLWFSLCALALAGAAGLGIMNKRRRAKGR